MAQARQHSAVSAAGSPPAARFPSRIDAWLWALAGLSVAVGLAAVVYLARHAPWAAALTMALICVFAAVLPLWVMLGTVYELTEEALLVRGGPFRWRVPLSQVRRVTISRSVLSAPALSLRRLRIEYGRAGSLLISPRDERGFLAELRRRCPGLQVEPS